MAKHVSISVTKKDGTVVKSIGGWKGDITCVALVAAISTGIVTIGAAVHKTGKQVVDSFKK